MPRRLHAALLSLAAAAMLLAGASASRASSHWVPPQQLSWYWQLQGTVDNSQNAAAYDIDGFGNGAGEVAALHAAGKHVICYIDAGTWENWRPDAGSFPSSVLGSGNGWPGERWLDIRQLAVLEPIMTARFRMCAQAGFDAIEPDNIDGYANSTGFPLTAQDQLAYNQWLASEAHSLGLAVFQKNDPDQASALEPYFDGVIDEQCNQYNECSSFNAYLAAGKPVLNAEYSLSAGQFCAADNSAGIMGAVFSLNLDGSSYQPCWSGSPGGGPPVVPTPQPSSAPPPGGSSAGGASGGVATPAPRPTAILRGLVLGLRGGTLIDRRGAVAVPLLCRQGRLHCSGSLMLVGPVAGAVLGRQRFRIAPAHAEVIPIRLSARAQRLLARARTARITVSINARDASGRSVSSRRAVSLRLP